MQDEPDRKDGAHNDREPDSHHEPREHEDHNDRDDHQELLRQSVRRELLRYAVRRAIFCQRCGSVLDLRRAVLRFEPSRRRAEVLCTRCWDGTRGGAVENHPGTPETDHRNPVPED